MLEFVIGILLGVPIGMGLFDYWFIERVKLPRITPRRPGESLEQYAYRLGKETTRAEAEGKK